ncbi:MAG: class I SAM-dependent rRNA methyltransferase [Nitrospirae bacterium]|nr:class I SAM-dependent rRNA methyltransferase [Nitrospirota bacterium]MCL5976657.1 class I SAM-dependent rRNA methyltransferase [Nitrospirota bacterium]
MYKVILRRTSRIDAGHLWIFSNELAESPKKFEAGSLVEVYDNKNRFIGIGYVNPNSLIAIRILTRGKETINADFFRKRISGALNYRKRFLTSNNSYRVIYSEGDFLPGLIVDKYADCLVIQILTLGMEMMKDMIVSVLDEIIKPSVIVLRNDSQSRNLEGLPLEKAVVKGALGSLPLIQEGEISIEVDPMTGQKTGFFLDQRANRLALAKYIDGGKGLDLFCYSGAWGLQLAKNGAVVRFVDDSKTALSTAQRNARINNLEERCEFVKDDVFNFLKKEAESGALYDFIVLDPPAFVKSRAKIKEALRAYREINAMAMRLVKNGGILATSSCSYHVEKTVFLDILHSAARDAGRSPRLLEYRSQGLDHPILLSVSETEYLKCAFLVL